MSIYSKIVELRKEQQDLKVILLNDEDMSELYEFSRLHCPTLRNDHRSWKPHINGIRIMKIITWDRYRYNNQIQHACCLI